MKDINGKKRASSYVKYPANCAMRLSSTPGSDGDNNDHYEPKQNNMVVVGGMRKKAEGHKTAEVSRKPTR